MDQATTASAATNGASRAFYACKAGKGHLLILVEHEGTHLAAAAAYCSPREKEGVFDPKGVTEAGKMARMIVKGRLNCDRRDEHDRLKTKVVLCVSQGSIRLALPMLREELCRLRCAPSWAQKAAKQFTGGSAFPFVGADK
tara:strand:- start:752 stop:1174 length:423 start_codon:yes stop_codon:yes gene_type:complete